jgi:hypothetical protein
MQLIRRAASCHGERGAPLVLQHPQDPGQQMPWRGAPCVLHCRREFGHDPGACVTRHRSGIDRVIRADRLAGDGPRNEPARQMTRLPDRGRPLPCFVA